MMELDDMDALAAEYVLGTLDRDERMGVAARREREPALAKAIADWERRLGPMVEVVAPVSPPPHLYSKIRAQIGLSAHVVSLRARETELTRKAKRWRRATIGISALAASLLGVIGWRELDHRDEAARQFAALEAVRAEQRQMLAEHKSAIEKVKADAARSVMPTQYIAVLQSHKDKPAFLMTLDAKSNMCVISAIAAPKQKDKSYEVWLVHDKLPKPKSLGIYQEGDMRPMPMLDDPQEPMLMNATFAVSLEPEGGSPTGGPTGPVLYTGKLVQATP
ncbi:MAG: anti-sigma factor [Hyphomicrobium sp.]